MKFTIQVNEGPYQHQSSDSAYFFAKAALEKGHEIFRVFFYHDGVNNGTRLTTPHRMTVISSSAGASCLQSMISIWSSVLLQRSAAVSSMTAKQSGTVKMQPILPRDSVFPVSASWLKAPFRVTVWSSLVIEGYCDV